MADFASSAIFNFEDQGWIPGQDANLVIQNASSITYVNRVFDDVANDFVRWETSSPDSTGASYPGPDSFVNTSDYCIESRLVS